MKTNLRNQNEYKQIQNEYDKLKNDINIDRNIF